MSTFARPALRKRLILGWREVERRKASIRARQRSVFAPKRVR
ncbi:MAG TPA: hypothetical protein VFP36_06860 [Usitatibacter sp.]|nr:hypothetical protein [Usitatibacter sp.]